ncbi:CRISPR-associated endonuclease Cas2 [Candidatus Methylomicrobium oryzae]|uniref:CRISPR-associated endonuclease Cas2 n=1 Tax=Candidatus Methylomicrobium oryzae TaxID=2802053 RepID=UPI001922C85A|nr:CRISPR-associated endonuclease Cas2 [Methylomicrobium sp. RS1]MBL1266005.1 CRISPR-associated endonuclease Cas2 [Methylomicrobium sp. RS1]
MSHVKRYLICYDIREPKRLRRLHRALRDVGEPKQYSVFEADLNESELATLLETVGALIDPEQDCVSLYPLPPACRKIQLGKDLALSGLILT